METVQQALKSGRYLSAALSEFQVQEEIRRARFAELKSKLQVRIEQLDRGETADFDLNELLAARNAEHGRASLECKKAASPASVRWSAWLSDMGLLVVLIWQKSRNPLRWQGAREGRL